MRIVLERFVKCDDTVECEDEIPFSNLRAARDMMDVFINDADESMEAAFVKLTFNDDPFDSEERASLMWDA